MNAHHAVVRLDGASSPITIETARRVLFALSLAGALVVPRAGVSFWSFPALARPWALAPFAVLFLLAVLDLRQPISWRNLDLLALLAPVLALADWTRGGTLQFVLLYGALGYLALRMTILAGLWGEGAGAQQGPPFRAWLPLPWLASGVLVLAFVHGLWTLDTSLSSDIGQAGVHGAERLLSGRAIYGGESALAAAGAGDPHLDSYGPFAYEAVAPFTWLAGGMSAARLAALFFDLATALALFVLGRRTRDSAAGLTLALAWLAFPPSLYVAELGANDALLSASVLFTLICARLPARRGAALALAAWSKLSPLALVPLLAGARQDGPARPRRTLRFAAGFALASLVIFLPVIAHGDLASFLARTVGFQSSREPAYSIWELLDRPGAPAAGHVAGAILRGVLLACTGVLAIALFRLEPRAGLPGIAAAGASVLIALVALDGYFSFTYLCWFAPLVLVACLLSAGPSGEARDRANAPSRPELDGGPLALG